MEIPTHLKTLYSHWEKHTEDHSRPINIDVNLELISQIEAFISERMKIWEQKEVGQKPPFTKDTVLNNYRFCNIYRELDKQTITIHSTLNKLRDNFDLWLLNLMFERFICKPETIEKAGFLNFDAVNNKEVYKKLKNLPSPKYGTAYIFPISIIQNSEYPTREEFFCFGLPELVKKISPKILKFENKSALSAMEELCRISEVNFRFHFTEILIDIAYQFPELINLFDEFYIGPGSLPTMKALANEDPIKTCLNLSSLKLKNFPYLTYNGKPVLLSVENWEGIGCEFRKYTNLSKGEGRRRIYTSA